MIDYDVAQQMIAAAHAEAVRRSVRVSVAVVDTGGTLIAFGRMDGAEIAGPTLAIDKAYTAVSNTIATSELADLAAPGGELFGLHANGNGRFVIFGGGIPVLDDGVAVAAIGVSGAAVADDVACAEAGIAVLSSPR